MVIDLKTGKLTHQDIGQMDMYVRMYDETIKGVEDNPTVGIVLCCETDRDIARYSILKGNEQIFATKYKLYLPTAEELAAEIAREKAVATFTIISTLSSLIIRKTVSIVLPPRVKDAFLMAGPRVLARL